VRQLVGMQRHYRAADDGEQAERHPAASSGHGESVANIPVTACPDITSMILPNSTGSANWAPASSRLATAGSSQAAPPCRAVRARGCRGGAWTCDGNSEGGPQRNCNLIRLRWGHTSVARSFCSIDQPAIERRQEVVVKDLRRASAACGT
jgi:hypothetical protein